MKDDEPTIEECREYVSHTIRSEAQGEAQRYARALLRRLEAERETPSEAPRFLLPGGCGNDDCQACGAGIGHTARWWLDHGRGREAVRAAFARVAPIARRERVGEGLCDLPETPSEAEARELCEVWMKPESHRHAWRKALAAYRAAVLRAEREETVGLVERLREAADDAGCWQYAVRDADAWLAKRKGGA